MKYCGKCKVKIVGERNVCPLCQGILPAGDGNNEEVFPKIPTMYRKYNLFFCILILVSIAAEVVSAAVNLMIPQSGGWAWFVVLGIACMWIMLAVAVRRRSNIAHSIVNQVFLVCVLTVLWDWLTGWRVFVRRMPVWGGSDCVLFYGLVKGGVPRAYLCGGLCYFLYCTTAFSG